jgi:hypothetical protein
VRASSSPAGYTPSMVMASIWEAECLGLYPALKHTLPMWCRHCPT